MIAYREVPETDIIEIEIDGAISKEEFDDAVAKFEAAIARHGEIRVLEHVRSFKGMPPSKFWEDLKFGLRHLHDFSRVAVVADAKWIEAMTSLAGLFLSGRLRCFDSAEIDEARAWLRASE